MNDTLKLMFECLSKGDEVFLPSKFWEALNQKNVKQLETEGFDNFKQTLAQNYFTWVVIYRDVQFLFLLKNTKLSSWPAILKDSLGYKPHPRLTRRQQIELTVFTKMLWKYVANIDVEGLLESINEPAQGNTFEISFLLVISPIIN